MRKLQLILLHSFPFGLGIILSYFFWRNNLLLLMLYCLLTIIVVQTGRDRKIEWQCALYGLAAGFIVETLGTQISGYQSFTQPQLLGIPYWLLVSWGYGFILMKRIGFILARGSAWAN